MVLEDDKQLFPPYQKRTINERGVVETTSGIRRRVERVSWKITAEQMSRMNYEVGVEGKTAETVAREFLKAKDSIKQGNGVSIKILSTFLLL